jgi:initiation factor 1A
MVKNTTGGNKSKGKASKSFAKPTNTFLRLSHDEDNELYAQVIRPLGNGMCHVQCIKDGATRLCHIRGKFRGRGKGDNIVKNGSWLLVGLREWERASTDAKKFQNCDLLEVYTDVEKEKLRTSVKINWSLFNTDKDETDKTKIASDADYIVFADDKTDEYEKLISAPVRQKDADDNIPGFVDFNQVVENKKDDEDDIIDIDDI